MRKPFIFFILLFLAAWIEIQPLPLFQQTAKTIHVEVKGELDNPGVFTLPAYATFKDLLNQLQLNDQSDIAHLSQLQLLEDGQVLIIRKQADFAACISINSAEVEELMQLSGIGESIAKAIIEYRQVHGGFKTLEELMQVKGIKETRFERIKDQICLARR